jgi:hypothetical protein
VATDVATAPVVLAPSDPGTTALHGKRRFPRDIEPAMSDKNLTALREGFEGFEREGAPIFDLLDPEVSGRPS